MNIISDPAEWAAIETAWTARAEELFTRHTERWTEEEKARFRDALNDKLLLPRTTRELAIAEDERNGGKRDLKRDAMARQIGEALDD